MTSDQFIVNKTVFVSGACAERKTTRKMTVYCHCLVLSFPKFFFLFACVSRCVSCWSAIQHHRQALQLGHGLLGSGGDLRPDHRMVLHDAQHAHEDGTSGR